MSIKKGGMWRIILDFLPELKRHPWWGALFVLMIGVTAALSFVEPYVFKLLTDGFVAYVSDGTGELYTLIIVVLVWFAVNSILGVLSQVKDFSFYTLMHFNYHRFTVDSFARLLRKNISVFNQYKSGYLVDLFDRGVEARWAINGRVINRLFPSMLAFVVVVVMAWFVSWQLTVVVLLIVPVQALVSVWGYRATKALSDASHKEWSKTYGVFGDVIQNIYATKSYAMEQFEHGRVQRYFKRALDIQNQSNFIWMWIHMINVRTLAIGAIWLASAYLIVNDIITLGTAFMFTALTRYIIDPIQIIANELSDTQRQLSKFDLLEKVLQDDESVVVRSGSVRVRGHVGHYVLDRVSFAHDGRMTLKDVSVEIKKGERIALVGPSGAGKSTLALLLARFYDPVQGHVYLDGVDLREWNYDALRKHIAVVWQENMLFHETLKFNVTYGRRGASDRAVNRALREACVEKFIKRQHKGIHTLVGERGIRLSGGEKQRVMIARALLKDPDIVILDEATSALDSITERDVQKGIEKLVHGKTAVIIAHRLSTIKHVDRIFVMDAGRVVAQGTHDQLLQENDLYRRMVHVQTDGLIG